MYAKYYLLIETNVSLIFKFDNENEVLTNSTLSCDHKMDVRKHELMFLTKDLDLQILLPWSVPSWKMRADSGL